ncbi:tetratricopeptide repeat protein [Candidatus Poribacteria bacterium]|nr:tetratricopeptide repeat protein [Candidatus Poribacteria bacterium]MYF54384.1 tetratricopeptide repeat protein [Candidatus Poribacteria bacterium]
MSIKIICNLCIILILLILVPSIIAHDAANTGTTTTTADYFDYITLFSDGKITRFAEMPITVYISPVIKESPYLPELRYAMHEWTTASDELIQFQETDTPDNADIRVSWGYSSYMKIHDTRLGSAQLRRIHDNKAVDKTEKSTIKVEIILILEGDKNITELSQVEMRTVCLHEFGHAIGLWGHSPYLGDICYPTATTQHLSQRDLNTLRKLYNTAIDTPQHKVAIKALKVEILQEPREHYHHFLLGNVYFDKGDMDSAIDSYKDCIAINEHFQPAIEKLLQAYEASGQLSTAINLLEQKIIAKPRAVDYNTLGIYYYKKGQVGMAIDAFQKAVALNPLHKASKHNLQQLFREKAHHALKVKNFETAKEIFDKIIQLNPMDAKTYMLMGQGYARAGHYKTAINYYQKAHEINPVSKLTKTVLAETYNNYGVTLRNGKKWNDAIAAYQKALEIQPEFHIAKTNLSDAFWQKANAYRESGQLDDAINAYLELRKLQPKDMQISSLLGELYLKKRNYSAAVTEFNRVYLSDPDNPQTRQNLIAAYHQSSQSLIKRKDFVSAIDLLKKAVVIAPTKSSIRVSLAHAYQSIGEYERAETELEQVLKHDPHNQQATTEQINLYIRRGNALVKQKNYPAALAQYIAIPETERDVVINNIIGYLYLVQKKYSEALTLFEKVISEDPRNSSCYQNLMALETQVGKRLLGRDTSDIRMRVQCLLAICLLNRNKPDDALTKYKQAIDTKSDKHQKLLYDTGLKLESGFKTHNDFERSATVRKWIRELK